jgi:alpha-mannosidase
VQEDSSDTWSHGLDRYAGTALGAFEVEGLYVEETGPVRATVRVEASFNRSTATLWARLFRESGRVDLSLRLDWHEHLAIAKLVLPFAMAAERLDGVPGGGARRAQDGRETPVIDWTVVTLAGGGSLGIAMPDCGAVDGTIERLRLTLVRSPACAWHDPAVIPAGRAISWLDQGAHDFRIALLPGADAAAADAAALGMHRPPACIDWTRGMRAKEAQ